MRGSVTELAARGFGFIQDENGEDRFFHARSMRKGQRFDLLRIGQVVEFSPAQGDPAKGNGLAAEDVRPC